jgi:hypothetical protein
MEQMTNLIKTAALVIAGFLAGFGPLPKLAPIDVSSQNNAQQTASSTGSFASLKAPVPLEFPKPTLFYIKPEQNPPKQAPVDDERKAVGEDQLGKPKPHNFGPPQPIQTLPLSLTCDDQVTKNVSFEIHRALLFRDFPDLDSQIYLEFQMDFPDVNADAFLVLEGNATNKNTTTHLSRLLYANEHFALKRPNSTYGGYGASRPLLPYTTGYFASIFPVQYDEKQFTVLFCDLNKPTVVSLDFTSPGAKTIQGIYRFNEGVF